MDTPILVSIIVATIAIIPGIWALINQANKDKAKTSVAMLYGMQNKICEVVYPLQEEINRLKDLTMSFYEKPVITRCKYCKSANVITNSCCLCCGAPLEY